MDLILVVLYKQKASESQTLLSFCDYNDKLEGKLLYIWDNSPSPLDPGELIMLQNHFEHFKYKNSKDNRSLSEVYNTVIRDNHFEKLFIFDQDTIVKRDYFISMDFASKHNKDVGLFLPFVKSNNKIVSPLHYRVLNLKHLRTVMIGKTIAKNRTAFASGLCVKESVFKKDNIWFDQKLTFYGIDYKFILDYGDFYNYFYVIDYNLEHSLSFTQKEDKQIKTKRFKSNIYANFYIAADRFNYFEKFVLLFRSFIGSVKMSVMFKDFCFIQIFARNINYLKK
jgi:hypothetical protein